MKRLRYLVAIADCGSMSAAGRHLHVAQPALSYHLSETEDQLGAPLFERTSKGMIPTVIGALYLEHARLILDAADLAEADIRRQVARPDRRASFRLVVIPSLASRHAPAMLNALQDVLPKMNVHFIEARTRFAEEQIFTGKADAAIALSAEVQDDQEVLVHEPLYCVVPARTDPRPMPFSEVASGNLILPSRGNPLREFLERSAKTVGLTLNVMAEIDGYEPRLSFVQAGGGMTVIGSIPYPEETLGDQVHLCEIVDPPLRRPIVLLLREELDPKLKSSVRRALQEVLVKSEIGSERSSIDPTKR